MEYINFEAEDENASDNEELVFSDHEGKIFIDNSSQENNQSPSFYRFVNQTRDPAEAVNENEESHLDRGDSQPEIFYCVNREQAELREIDDYQKCVENFLKTLCSFQGNDLKDSFLMLLCTIYFLTLKKTIRLAKTRQKRS